ncbi:phage protein NinX family protein [Pseudomonas putida]|uniref:phage protein NinX family protein n=1 Tax=Pseudomonas putida TaxID=303 RepID=UPI0023660232|nr:phage protein NinX family protein [Pseudomonas putida]MDD2046153.1 DUF2591 domain-containing protein [Pseudomonas putida]
MTDLIEVKTADLAGEQLAWAVAKAEGLDVRVAGPQYGAPARVFVQYRGEVTERCERYNPHENWALGGPLKTKHQIGDGPALGGWTAYPSRPNEPTDWLIGPSPLVAICRAVISKVIGNTVQVPKELLP